MGLIGEILSTETQVMWKVNDLSLLSESIDVSYTSAIFDFAGRSWYLVMFPNGEVRNKSEGWIGLYLFIGKLCRPLEVDFTLTLRNSDEIVVRRVRLTKTFKENGGWGFIKIARRSDISSSGDESPLTYPFTVFAVLMADFSQSTERTPTRGLKENFCLRMKKILSSGERSDVTFKLGHRDFPAHRLILESRSSVFSAMFSHETGENKTWVIKISDIEPDVFKMVLSYIYSGEVTGISTQNVCGVYVAADEYNLRDLRKFCISYIQNNISQHITLTILFSQNVYREEVLIRCAKDYFKKNSVEILDSEKWKVMVHQNQEMAAEILHYFYD